jgi:tetratricopeptide (TPR) repeat protein
MNNLFNRLLLVCLASCWPLHAQTLPAPATAQPVGIAAGAETGAARQSLLALERGKKLRENKQFAAALQAHQEAVRLHPENGNAWFYLGMSYVDVGRFEEARYSLKRSVLASPKDAANWYGLCLVHYLLEDYARVVTTCQQVVRIDPKLADGWAWMGLGYAGLGRWDKAMPSLEGAASLGTKNSQAWYTLGIRYARRGERSKVLKVYRHLQNLDPAQARRFFDAAVFPQIRT